MNALFRPHARMDRAARSGACERTRTGIMREEFATVAASSSYVSGRRAYSGGDLDCKTAR